MSLTDEQRDNLLAALEAANARADAAELHAAELRDALIKHRAATHEVTPMFCVTCRESDAKLAAAQPSRGMSLLEAAEEMASAWEDEFAPDCPSMTAGRMGQAYGAWRALVGRPAAGAVEG